MGLLVEHNRGRLAHAGLGGEYLHLIGGMDLASSWMTAGNACRQVGSGRHRLSMKAWEADAVTC